ncbi:diguanylate cyclase [Clostridium sp. CS001]|uniref:diguanylate cyclase n=1 Tax=Clostridium sp. CS001 TaxID=2880648 RepID=UPI001CF3DE1A|nr:diguanylate cyclase [Clostridium sp. CS001]MCB2290383.1 diguanylate cyclase [Clostridium sp. CS001]
MEIINNRYRIVRCIKQNRIVSSYVVNDIMKNYDTLQLNILNLEYIQKDLIEFYTKEFASLTNIVCQNITSVYEFSLINLLDNKKLNDKVYFYTTEYVQNSLNILDMVTGMQVEELLDLFIEACKGINYLHLKGVIYGEVNLANIIVDDGDASNEKCIKFKDIPTVQLEKQDFWKVQDSQEYFKAPEILEGSKVSVLSDIYSLGMLLFVLYMKSKNSNYVIGEEVESLDDYKLQEIFKGNEGFDERIKSIIEKMINSDTSKRYESISDLVTDINIFFHKEYTSHRNEEIEKLNFNLKIIGRDEEIMKVIDTYESIKDKNHYNSTILIHGETGIGKTRFLKEIKYLFSIKKVRTYSSFILDASSKNSDKAFLDILKQFISECEPEVLERYEQELVKFIPELGGKKSIMPSEPLSGDKEKFRLIHSAMGFIEECINNTPIVIIIDNFHLADDFTIELIEYLIRKKSPNKNIMVVMSYCDGECVSNKKFLEFIKNITLSNGVTNLFLEELGEIEVAKMVQGLLNMLNTPYKLAESVYDKTKGNPLFVEEVIKSLYNKGYIYIDKDKGYWTKDYEYSKFIIPSDMHEVLLNQVKGMGEVSYSILKTISIFKSAVSLDMIGNFVEAPYDNLDKAVKVFISSGILCKKIEDRGFVFDFYNKFLKSLIYEKITEEDSAAMHKLAAKVLETQYAEGGTEYIEELIYHLEKSKQVQKIIHYYVKNAENMRVLKNRSGAIKNLTKAVAIMDYSVDQVKNVKIIIDLADLHEQEGNMEVAINYYLSIQKYKEDTELSQYIIDSLIKVASVFLSKNDIDSTVYYIGQAQLMLEKADYILGMLKAQSILASICDRNQEYEKVQDICNRCIGMCIGEYEELKVMFYNHKGLAYLRSGRTDEALLVFEENIMLCIKYNNIPILLKSLNNIGVIYGDYYQEEDKALMVFLELKELCEKNNMSSSEIGALINIGATYFSKEQYEISLQYFIESLEKCRKYEDERSIFYCYTSMASVYLNLGDYGNAYKYYEICNKELGKYPNQGKDIGEFYLLASELNYRLGDLNKANFYINEALSIYEYDESVFKWRAEILNEYIKFYLLVDGGNLSQVIEKIITIASKVSSMSSRLNILYDAIIFLHENRRQELMPPVFTEVNKINIDIKDRRVYVKKLYIDAVLDKKKNSKALSKVLEYSKRYKEIDISWKVNTEIGNCYLDKKDYLYAVIYYFEACGILKDIILQVPLEYRLTYMKQNNALKPFNRFICINNYYKSNKNTTMIAEEVISVNDEKELSYLLEQVNHKDILNNKNFIKSVKKIYSSSLHEDIHDISDVLENLQSDNAKNLELIIDYLSYITLATRGTIIISDNDQEFRVIASSDRRYELPQGEEVLFKALSRERPVLVTDGYVDTNINGDRSYSHNTLKASICIPIIMEGTNEKDYFKNERKRRNGSNHVVGYVYIESNRVLNNINKESMKDCLELSKVIGIILEKYKLRLSSSIDKLTGTLTRKYLEEALDEQIEVSSKAGSKFSLIMYDLDHFKMVNDKFGHRTGDYALKRVCDVVMSNIRETDIVGRYGGEEFIVILPNTDINDAEHVAEKLRSKIEQEKILDNRPITVSLGVAEFPLHGEWQDELVERVDQALYVAKHQGRNRYAIWNSEFSKKAKRTDRLTGIISGNVIQDHRNVLAMIELIELINIDKTREDKIYNLLGRIIEITEAQKGILFILDNDNCLEKYSRKVFENQWINIETYNKDIIQSVTNSKQGVCKIDWDIITEYDTVTGVPNWQSIMVIPLIRDDVVKGILYLTESTQTKEFGVEDFNFASTLGKIIVPIL